MVRPSDSPGCEWYELPDSFLVGEDDWPEPDPAPVEPFTVSHGWVSWRFTPDAADD